MLQVLPELQDPLLRREVKRLPQLAFEKEGVNLKSKLDSLAQLFIEGADKNFIRSEVEQLEKAFSSHGAQPFLAIRKMLFEGNET